MKTIPIRASGLVTFWAASACPVDKLRAALKNEGLDEYCPNPRTDYSALENALKDYGKATAPTGHDTLVKPLSSPGENGQELTFIQRGSVKNLHSHQLSARIEEGRVEITAGSGDRQNLQDRFDNYKAQVTSEAVGGCLVNLALRWLDGISLRETGGIYWVPDTQSERWELGSRTVEQASGSCVTTGVWEANASTIEAVRRRIVKMTKDECRQIMEEISDGKSHDDQWYARRLQQSSRLLQRVQRIEESLQVTLQDCHERIGSVESVVLTMQMCSSSSVPV